MALLTNINGKFSVSDVGAVTFNNAFTFPTADGAANYVLQTNGSGQLAWALNGNGDISGSGTANTVTKFTGAKTIGNGPITFSGDNSIFTGNVTVKSDSNAIGLRVNGRSSDDIAEINMYENDGTTLLGSIQTRTTEMNIGSITSIPLLLKTGGTTALTIDTSQNSTFAGTIASNNIAITNSGNGELSATRTSGATVKSIAQSARGQIGTSSNHELQLITNSTSRLTIDTSGNSTFAGDVLVEDNLYLTDAGTVRGKIQLNASDRS
jgi:hypothetical protein